VHGNEGRGISTTQQAALDVLRMLPGVGAITVEQYRALEAAQKPVDAVLEEHGILIDIDGKQHELHNGGWGEEAGVQWARDRQFDRAVLSMGKRPVRLHWCDEASWSKHVQAAIERVQREPGSSFVYYSASYPQWCRVTVT
jgi:hypothetical protein